jgi:lipoate-protein ligase A
MERWRLITTWGAAPGFNMGLDEALLESAGSPPTLRFYTWHPATLSLGYFQRFDDVPAAAQARAVVRRITGGGAIHHVNELTFSITAPLEHRIYAGPVAESYERVHRAIARSLRELGAPAELRGAAPLDSDRSATGMCFHESTPLDLAWNARKGVGSAQRRKAGRVLHVARGRDRDAGGVRAAHGGGVRPAAAPRAGRGARPRLRGRRARRRRARARQGAGAALPRPGLPAPALSQGPWTS